ncbi:MAG: HEAT repeat domain-containing protein [Candidatus Eisenbacteria bacterium]|nr:HEAT repeat domain-containing protein [Candidatus Eisenbacteria bacterium]
MKYLLFSGLLLCLTLPALAKQPAREAIHDIYYLQDQRSLGDERLFRHLHDARPEVALRAAIAFGNIQDTSQAVVEQLGAALLDAGPDVAKAIAFALGQLGPNRSVEQAIDRGLEKREEPGVRSELLESLGKIGGEASLREVAAEFKMMSDSLIDGGTALGIARFGLRGIKNREATAVIARLAHHEHPAVRSQAAYAFWRIGDPELLKEHGDTIIKLASDPAADVRMFAVNALARLEDSEKVTYALLACFMHKLT